MKRLTSVLLLLALTFQTGCLYSKSDPLPPPVPGDSAARMIREADRVLVTTLEGDTHRFTEAEVDATALRGWQERGRVHWTREVPLDSIAEIRVLSFDLGRTVLLQLGLTAVFVLLLAASNPTIPLN